MSDLPTQKQVRTVQAIRLISPVPAHACESYGSAAIMGMCRTTKSLSTQVRFTGIDDRGSTVAEVHS